MAGQRLLSWHLQFRPKCDVRMAVWPTRIELLKVFAELMWTQSGVVDRKDLQRDYGPRKGPLERRQWVCPALAMIEVA